MRYILRTNYDQDLQFFKGGWPQYAFYGGILAAALVAPMLLGGYFVSQITFIWIYAIATLGLQVLLGFCGLLSVGQAAFLAIGAYAYVYLQNIGLHFALALPAAAMISGLGGVLLGIPVLRLRGLYLAMATMSLGFIVEEIAARWEHVTGGNNGALAPSISLGGLNVAADTPFYYLCLAILLAALLVSANILRSPTGRAMISVRDSIIAAQSAGVNIYSTKLLAFGISAFLTGIAGALYAQKLTYISPDQFHLGLSIELLIMVLVGGISSLRGAIIGAAFIVVLPELLVTFEDIVPGLDQPAIRPMIFGLILVFVMIFEPRGLNGLLEKFIAYFQVMPLFKKGTFRRQRGFAKSERW